MTEADLPLVRRWLLEPHVRRWWDEENDPTYPEPEIDGRLRAIRHKDPTDHFVMEIDNRPVGDIQSYRIQDHPDWQAQIGIDEPAFGIDVYIGEPDVIGHGVGPALVTAFLRDVAFPRYDVDLCVLDPTRSNASAIRAYEKVGFTYIKDVIEEGTKEPEHYLMGLRRSTWGVSKT